MGWDIIRALPRLCPALPGSPRPLHVSGRAPPPRCLRPSGLPINCYTTRVCATRRAGTERNDSAVEDARRARRARGDQRGCRTRARTGGPAPDRPRACAVGGRRGALWEPPEPATAATLEPLKDVHLGLAPRPGRQALLSGHYLYYHYGCDGVDDRGWGCGYRTLQTLCSWPAGQPTRVPTLAEVQAALEDMGDKPRGFRGSRDWIGCVEACLCLDYFGGPQGRLCHVPRGAGLRGQLDSLYAHFSGGGGPVMVGGDADAQSKALLGVCLGPGTEASVLVLDPHCWGAPQSPHDLQTAGWVGWRNVSTTFDPTSFYNLCLTSPSPDSKGAHSRD